MMSGSYHIGDVSGSISKKRKKNKDDKLSSLFSTESPYRPVFIKATERETEQVKTSSASNEKKSPEKKTIKSPETESNLQNKSAKKKKRKSSEKDPEFDEFVGQSPKKKKKKLSIEALPISQEHTKENLTVKGKKLSIGSTSPRGSKSSVRVGGTSNSDGFCPPPGIVHEALVKKNKKKNKSRVEERESELAEAKTPSKKKKRKLESDEEAGDLDTPAKKVKREKDPNVDARTIFVGNLPIEYNTKAVRKLFKKYGELESVRLRSATPAEITLSKKVAVIKKEYHPDRSSINAYVVFKEEESAKKSLKKNGKLLDKHHIVVDLVSDEKKHNHKKSVFVGNLPFAIEEDELWECFNEVGDVSSVRIVRDGQTGVGKGFGYVQFKDESSVDLALKLNNAEFKSRKLRVMRSVPKEKLDRQLGLKKNKLGKKDKLSKGTFQGQKALTDTQLKKIRQKKKKFRAGQGKKKNAVNAMKRLGRKDRTQKPKSPKTDKKGLGASPKKFKKDKMKKLKGK